MTDTSRGSLAVIGAAFLWSLDGILRRQLFHLPPSIVVFLEHTLGFITLLPILIAYRRKKLPLSKQQWKAIIIVSLFSGVLGTVFYTAALGAISYIPFSVVVLLQQTQPIFAIGSARIFLREPLGKRFLSLMALALVATFFISFPHLRVHAADKHNIQAALLALGAAACWGISTALSKYSLKQTPFIQITAIRFGLTSIFSLGLILLTRQEIQRAQINLQDWQALLAITCSTGLVALILYYFGLQKILASRSTLLELIWPLSSVVIGYLFFQDRLTATQIIGSIALLLIMKKIQKMSYDC